jgi:hypothetical protein
MQVARWSMLRNPGGLLAWCGTLALVASVLVPFLVARRAAQIEQTAARLAARLLQAALDCPDPLTAADLPMVTARFHCLAQRDDLPSTELEALPPPRDLLLLLGNRDYLFHLAVAPPEAQAIVSPDSAPAYEVVAWPRHAGSRGRSVFCEPSDGLPAYTRNLVGRHLGAGVNRPVPGQQQRLTRSASSGPRSYRSAIDERWLESAEPAGGALRSNPLRSSRSATR